MAQSSSQARSEAGAKSWFGNAMKSAGRASMASFKKIAPNISSAGAGMYEGGKKVKSSLRPANLISIARDLSKNKYVKIARKSLDQSIKDIKSGNLYNPDRGGYGGDDEGFDFSGFGDDDDFGSDGGDNFFINESSEPPSAATFAVTKAVGKSAEATLSVGNAMVDTMSGLSSAMISEIQSGFGEVSSKLETMNSTLTAILDFQNENTTKFYESVLGAIDRMSPPQKEDSFDFGSNDPMAVFGSAGGVSFSSYKDYIKRQMKSVVEKSPAGMIMGMLDENTIEMLFQDPVGGLTNTIVTAMVPNVVERTLKTLDSTLGDLEQNLLIDLGKWANDPSKNFVQKMIGAVFGVTPDEVSRRTNMTEVNKDAAVFDNITRNTITEVLPKYARESTAYLKEIAMHVTKKDQKSMISQSDVFDARQNKYVKQDDMLKNFLRDLSDGITGTFKNTDFGKAMNSISENLTDKERSSFETAFNQFIMKMATTDHNFTYRDFDPSNKQSPIYKLLKKTGNKRDRNLLRETMAYMWENGQAGSAARAQQSARKAWNDNVKDMSENFDMFNLHAMGIDNDTDLVNMILGYQSDLSSNEKKLKNSRSVKDVDGKRKRIKQMVSDSITKYNEYEEEFNSDRKLSGGQIAGKLFGEDFGQGFKEMGGHTVDAMRQIMRGDAKGAIAEFGKIFTGQMKNMWEGAKTHFIQPLAEKMYGKDEDGKAIGIFAGARNKLNDMYKAVVQKVNGKDYEDSAGNVIKAEPGVSLVDKSAEIFNTIKGSVVKVLFGDKVKTDKNGEPIEDAKKGLFGTITDTMKAGVQGWKQAVFGESEDPDEEVKKLKQKALDSMPGAIMGSAGGALVGALSGGSLFGMMIGGPVGGAAIGFASSFLARSSKFKDYLFGPEVEDENGKRRIGGLISEHTQKVFKENKNSMIGGAAIGALKSLVFPNSAGLMGAIVGGPIAGAAIGAGVGLLKKSDAFQKFLYGDGDKEGVIAAFKKMFKKNGKSDPEADAENMKAIGMGAIGLSGGALAASLIGKMGILGAMATPMGPLGGALIGAATGIAAGSRKFREFLFGKKDPETGDKKGGLFQKFGNFLHVEILSPMKDKVHSIIDDMMITFKYDVLETIRIPFTLMADKISEKIGNVKEFISDKVGGVIKLGVQTVTEKVGPIFMKVIFDPAKKILGKATDILYNFSKATVLAPFRLIKRVGEVITSPIRKAIGAVTKFTFNVISGIGKFTYFGIKKVFQGITFPFRKLGEFVSHGIQNLKDKAAEKFSGNGGGLTGKMYRFAAGLTNSDWRKGTYQAAADKAEAKAQAKADARNRSIQDYNRRLVARELGYDVKYFTADTMQAAIEHRKESGKKGKLRFRGAGVGQDISQYFEKDPMEERKKLMAQSTDAISRTGDRSEDVDIRQLTEQHRTNTILGQIKDFITGRSGKRRRGDTNTRDQSIGAFDETGDNINADLVREARAHGYDYNPQTGEFKLNEDYFSDNDSGDERGQMSRRSMKEWFNDTSAAIEGAGGIKNFVRNRVSDKVNQVRGDIKEGYQDSWLQGVVDRFKRKGHTRAAGGPMREGEPYIVGEGGNDMSGAELVVPNQDSTVFAQGREGINTKVNDIDAIALAKLRDIISKEDEDQESILTKTLGVLQDVAGDVPVIGKALSGVISIANERLRSSQFNSDINDMGFANAVSSRLPFGGHRAAGGAVAKNHAYLVGDGGTDPQAEEIFVPYTSGKILSQGQNGIKVVITGFTKTAKKDLEDVDFEDDAPKMLPATVGGAMTQTGTALTTVRQAKSYAVLREQADRKAEKEADNARQDSMLATMQDIRDKNVSHHNIWNSIFSKKGIVTMAILGIGLFLLKNLPKIMDFLKGFKNIGDAIMDFLDWGKDKGEGGKSISDRLADEAGQIADSAGELASGHPLKAMSSFILDNGKWDANSGGRVALLARFARKPLRTAIKVGSKVGKLVKKGFGKVKNGAKWAYGKAKSGVGKVANAMRTKFGKNTPGTALALVDDVSGEVIERVTGDVVPTLADDAAELGGRAVLGQSDDVARLAMNASASSVDDIAEVGGKALLGQTDNAVMALPGMLDDGTKIAANNVAKMSGKGIERVTGEVVTSNMDDIAKAGAKLASSNTDNVIEGSVRALRGGTAKNMAGLADDAAAAASKSSKGLMSKVIGLVDDFIKKIFTKVAGKMSGKIPGALTSVIKAVKECLKKHFTKISGKITAALGKDASGVATLGLSTVAFCTIGAINGATGAARLFKVKKKEVDPTMTLISTAMGALTIGTTLGSIIDVVSGLVYEILGFDFLGSVAMAIYQFLLGQDKGNELIAAQQEWQAEFEKFQSGQLEEELQVQKNAGLVAQDVTVDQFKEGLGTGQYASKVQSFQDWNAEKNQTLGYKVGKGLTKIGGGIGKIWNGKTKYTDEKGQQYVDNGDGTFTIIDSNGKKLGQVSKDAVNTENMQKDHKRGIGDAFHDGMSKVNNAMSNIGTGMKTAFGNVGKAIGSGINHGAEFVKGMVTGTAKTVKSFTNTEVDLMGYIKADNNTLKEDNPLKPVASGLLNTSKILMLPMYAVVNTGAKIGKAIGTAISSGAEAVRGWSTGMAKIKQNFDNPNMDVGQYFAANVSSVPDSNPLSGFINGGLNVAKYASFPVMMITGIGKKLGQWLLNGIKGIIGGVVKVAGSLATNEVALDRYVITGDLDGLNSHTMDVDESVPFAGVVGGIGHISKLFKYPGTALMWTGKKIAMGLASVAVGAGKAIGSIAVNEAKLQGIVIKGDLDALNTYEPSVIDGTPLSGIVTGLVHVSRFMKYPGTALMWTGHKIKDAFVETGKKVVKVGKTVGTNWSSLVKIGHNGDLDALGSWEPKVDEDTPISGLVHAALSGAKYVFYPGTAIASVMISAKKKIAEKVSSLKLGIKTIVNYGAELMKFADGDQDIDQMDNVKFPGEDTNPIAGIVGTITRFIVKPIVQVNRFFNSIGNWVQDKLKKGVGWLKNLLNFGKDVANGEHDEDLGIGGNGKGSRKQTSRKGGFGGRGGDDVAAAPDALNGAAYFSQEDPIWGGIPYIQKDQTNNDSTISDAGCGPVSMAMVAKQMGQSGVTPATMAQMAIDSGYRDETGTNEQFIAYSANQLGLGHTDVYSPSADYITTEVANGRPIVLNGMSAGEAGSPYTSAGHYVVAVGTDGGGNVIVNDPRGPEYSTAYNAEYLASQTRKAWSFGGDRITGAASGDVSLGGFGPVAMSRMMDGAAPAKPKSSTVGGAAANIAKAGLDAAKGVLASKNGTPIVGGTTNNTAQYVDPNLIDYARKSTDKTVHPDGTVGDWIEIVRKVKALVAAQAPEYYAKGGYMITINYDGENYTVRPDCTGIISTMLQIYRAFPKGKVTNSTNLRREGEIPKGFRMMPFPGWDGLREGDIICKPGHAEVFANNQGGHYVYNGGSTKSLGSAKPTISGGGAFTIIWRPQIPGNGGIFGENASSALVGGVASDMGGKLSGFANATKQMANVAAAHTGGQTMSTDGTTYNGNSSGYSASVSSGASSSEPTGEEPEELSFMDKLGKIGSIFTKLGSKALDGILLNKWNFDFSDKKAAEDSSSGSNGSVEFSSSNSSTSSTSGQVADEPIGGSAQVDYGATQTDEVAGNEAVSVMYNATNKAAKTILALTGATEKDKIYNHLRGHTGLNPAAAASVMGCWDVESGNKASRVEGDYLKKYWGHEKVLNNNQTMNAYTSEFLFPAYKRSNMSINQGGYKSGGNYYPGVGLAQWTGPRGQKLFDYAQKNNMAWGGLDTQLSYFDSELQGGYKGVKNQLDNVKTVEEGTEVVLDGYEMSKGYSKRAPKAYEKRLKAARAIYDQFGGKGGCRKPTKSTGKFGGKGQSNKAEDVVGKFPKIDLNTGRLNNTQLTSADGSTVYNVTQNLADTTEIEKILRKILKLLDKGAEDLKDPIRDMCKNSKVLLDLNESVDIIETNVIESVKLAKEKPAMTGPIGSGDAAAGAAGGLGGGLGGKNAGLAQQIAKG